MSRFADRRKGIRSYQSHVKSDPWMPLFFVLFFVLPSLAGAVYYGLIASDRYVTEARFAIRPAIGSAEKATPDGVGTNSGVPKEMIAQDTLITYTYILSRPMVETIEKELPIRQWFSRDSIDYLSRFDADKPIEKFLKYWRHRVELEVESSSGIMGLTVEAFDPDESLAIAKAVLKEAERNVNELSAAARNDALAESNRELALAEERLKKVSVALRDLRNREGVLDAQKSNEANLKVISELRANRIKSRGPAGHRPARPRAGGAADHRHQAADPGYRREYRADREGVRDPGPEQKRVLSEALTRFEALDNERKNATKYYESVLSAHERARIIAARQVEFFSPIVNPVRAESSTQPRRILMISLITAASAVLFAAALFLRKMID